MTEISKILSDTSHRPFELPIGQWKYYQEWNNAIFLHWRVPFETLRHSVPQTLHLDSYEGVYYISLVAFTMQKIRPRYLPSVKYISDFHEINLRTYIDNGGKKGVYFLNIEAEKHLSTFVAKYLSGLPYEKAIIKRSDKSYSSENQRKKFRLNAKFEVKEELTSKTELDKWLTERYSLYLDIDKSILRYDIHHKEWQLKNIEITNLQVDYKFAGIDLANRQPDITHYSDGVKVIAWNKCRA
jgi:uncharacterized protein YqjF (DUF2071 family)